MVTNPRRISLPGSQRTPLPGAQALGAVAPDERFEVTLRLRAKAALPQPADAAPGAAAAGSAPSQRPVLTREQFAERHGADAQDLSRVAGFAGQHGLVLVEASAARRSVVLSGTAQSLGAAFGVTLQYYEHDGGTYRGRTGEISIPAELAGVIEGVFGLDDRPQASAHFRRYRPEARAEVAASHVAPRAAPGSFTPLQLARLYNFPPGLDGSGQCIAIIELGGGYRPADLKAYFAALGLAAPRVKGIRVDGGRNQPGTADSADGEVMLDIEVAGAVAPKAQIAVYFAPNTDQGFLDAVTTAVHDSVNKPLVISISWGAPESAWTAQAMTQFDQAFQAAAAMGVTVCCAAGDNGSSDGVNNGKAHVDFPSSSPFALACGGTRLAASGSTIASEVVWNQGTGGATGGGVSGFFGLPGYQAHAHVPTLAGAGPRAGRGVPDVAADADPATGYQVRVDGQNLVIGGTSAVAPLWAGLVALMNQNLGHPVGFLNPLLYGALAGKGLLHDITQGSNGQYAARSGWDPCTGWGTPNGTRLLQALAA